MKRGGLLALAAIAAAACSKDTVVTTRTVTTHAPACAPLADPFALVYALGDFEPPADVPSLPLSDVGAQIAGAPADTRELEIDATSADESAWRAHGFVAATGDVDVLLLPYRAPCGLTDPIEARTDAAIGAVDAEHVLVAGGASSTGGVPTTALVDLARGVVTTLPNGLLVPRAFATITASPRGAIVAGGARPDTGDAQASAEVYDASVGDFTSAPIALSEARSHHAAVTLATGETLLVGGLGASGVLGSLEVVDGVAGRARTAGLTALAAPRSDATAIRLASGEVLVAGGLDANGAPVPTLEWLAPDASGASRRAQTLVASHHSAFVALEAGGALAVIAPDTSTSGFQNTWVIAADGSLAAATPVAGSLTAPALFAGPSGAPLLWTGDRWLQWQPWSGSFAALAGAPAGAVGPSSNAATAAEPGLALWIDGATVRALRFGVRGPYATAATTSPLLATDTSFAAPDRLVTGAPSDPIRFAIGAGVALDEGASVFLTDSTFADFMLDAEVPSGAPPVVVLRDASSGDETLLDPTACGFAGEASIHVARSGGSVSAAGGASASVTCAALGSGDARVAIGFRGASGGSSVVGVVVRR